MSAITSAPVVTGFDRRTKGNVLRLAIAQALAGANASVVVATGSIIGAQLAPDVSFATVPLSMYVVGMAAGTLPTGWLARRHGRRTAFLVGAGFGVLTGLLAALASYVGSFGLFCTAAFASGLYASAVQSFRFAAADGVSPKYRPRAVSWVMAGGVFAGVLGPQLVTWTMGIWPTYLFAASYLAQAGVAVVAMLVLAGVDLPLPPPPASGTTASSEGRPLGTIVRQPRFIAAATCGVVAYTLMNLVMTSAPLAMHMCGLPITASNFAIQWHVVAMYGPSFFTGALIARFGAPRIVAVGLVITLAAAATGLSGISAAHFSVALVLLGIGWNFGFVGASALVLETHRPEERTRVQSFNDFLVFGVMALGSFFSGHLLAAYGWDTVNLVAVPPVVVALVALAAAGLFRRRQDGGTPAAA